MTIHGVRDDAYPIENLSFLYDLQAAQISFSVYLRRIEYAATVHGSELFEHGDC